jgi:hypothetical protein
VCRRKPIVQYSDDDDDEDTDSAVVDTPLKRARVEAPVSASDNQRPAIKITLKRTDNSFTSVITGGGWTETENAVRKFSVLSKQSSYIFVSAG